MSFPARKIYNFFNPFGSLSSRNSLKENIVSNPNKSLRILLLGCGNLLDILRAIPAANDRKINFTINDVSQQVVARNILLIQIISSPEFNPGVEDDLRYFWDVCYNTLWPETTRKRFEKEVSQLRRGNITECVTFVRPEDTDLLNKVWDSWISCAADMDPSFPKNILKERMDYINQGTRTAEELVQQIKTVIDVHNLPQTFEKDILHVIGNYFKTGNSDLNEETDIFINPTFLETSTNCWSVLFSAHPYEEYLTITKETVPQKAFLHHCHEMLRKRLTLWRALEPTISLTFHIGDALDLCYHRLTDKFDLIDASSLCDRVGLVDLMTATDLCLCDDGNAVLLSEKLVLSSSTICIAEYVQETLCSPLSMLATIYGLVLSNHVLLGNPVPLTQVRRVCVSLTWKRSHHSNLTMTLTPSISSIIEQLYRSYSLFTYARVATALALRFHWKEGDYSAIFQPHDLKVAETRAHLEDVESSEAITSTTSLNDFSSEIVSHSKTFGQRLRLNERVSDAMPVNVCEEFEDRYQLELCLPNIHQFSGKLLDNLQSL